MKLKTHISAIIAFCAAWMMLVAGSAQAATVFVTPTSTDRLRSSNNTPDPNNVFSTWQSDAGTTNTQRTLQTTSNATFIAALQSTLGSLGVGQSYQINSATLTVGNAGDNFTCPSTVHWVLLGYTPGSVTWSNFNNGGVAGTDYATAAAATGTVGANSVTYNLTSTVQNWLSGSTSNMGVYFRSSNFGASPYTGAESYTAVANVSWTLDAQIIPEPSAALLGVLGLPLLLRRRR